MKLPRHRAVSRLTGPIRQRGLALVIVMLSVLGVLGFLMLSTVALNSALVQRQKPALPTLDEGRLALTGYSIGNMSTGQRPGTLPMPDSFAATESPADYDGDADGGCLDASKVNGLPLIASGANVRCLGRLPWRQLGMSIAGATENDVAGLMPWYAVSGNLTDPACLLVLNSNTLNNTYTSHVCNGATLPYPWLTVRDSEGTVISNRIAVVLIIPGPPLAGQSRPASPNLAGASQYLDSVTIGGTIYSNADMDNDFIIGRQSETFNDIVTYITIDDLMRDVEAAAASTAIAAVEKFRAPSNSSTFPFLPAFAATYPWLAPFADPTQPMNFVPNVGIRKGLLPVYVTSSDPMNLIYYPMTFEWQVFRTGATPAVSRSGTVTNAAVRNITTTNALVWRTGTKCEWTTQGLKEVHCIEIVSTGLPAGVSTREIDILFSIAGNPTITPASASTLPLRQLSLGPSNPSGWYKLTDRNASGIVVGSGQVIGGSSHTITARLLHLPLNSQLPKWFVDNLWHQVLYGAIASAFVPGGSSSCGPCLTVGEKTDVQFVVVAAGSALGGQSRPSALLSNYLESLGGVSNSDGDDVFTATHQPKSTTFNDQVFRIPQ